MNADPSFWVLLAFISLFALTGKKLWFFLTRFLDARAEKIRQDIKEAHQLKEEAQQLLDHALHLQTEVNGRIQEIMLHTKKEIERLREEAVHEIEIYLEGEERQLNERIEIAEQQALHDIEKKAVDVAVDAAKKAIVKNITNEFNHTVFQQAINKISTVNMS